MANRYGRIGPNVELNPTQPVPARNIDDNALIVNCIAQHELDNNGNIIFEMNGVEIVTILKFAPQPPQLLIL
jgi:hypothetical protein